MVSTERTMNMDNTITILAILDDMLYSWPRHKSQFKGFREVRGPC